MKTLKITWLDACNRCEFSEYAEVKTERGIGCYLFEGDIVICPECKQEGVIETDMGCAYVAWNEVES